MNDYATKLAEAFSQRVIQLYYEDAVSEAITNQDYEGEIKGRNSIVNIMTFGKITLQNYTGANLNAQSIKESVGRLITDQQKAFYFEVDSLDQFKSFIKNPSQYLLKQVKQELAETIDAYNLSFYADVQAGNRIGTNYTTGTVAVANDGTVTGVGTSFTSDMVGRGFKADGHTKWYRVKSVASATSLQIEQDVDDTDPTYDGGAIAAGASYVIEAVSPITVSTSDIYQYLVRAKTVLDQNRVPKDDRWVVLPSHLTQYLLQSPSYVPAVDRAYAKRVEEGKVDRIAGFMVFENEQVNGDPENGYHVLAGHRSAITYAMGMTESGIEDRIANFGKAYKGLYVYGSKVVDERRKALVELYLK